MNQVVPMQPSGAAAPAVGSMAMGLMPTNLRDAMDLATMMSKGKLVPEALRNSPADCLLVIEQAMRWSMSPFAVAQEVSVISGKLMHSGKIVAAAVQSSGLLQRRLQYEYSGEGETREVRVVGTLRGETEPREVTVKLKDVRTSNQQWTKQPDQQLAYSGSRVWGRRHTPEVMLGVWTPEEFDAEERAAGRGRGATISGRAEAVQAAPKQIAHEAATPTPDTGAASTPAPAGSLREVAEQVQQRPAKAPDPDAEWAAAYVARLKAATTAAELRAAMDAPDVYDMLDHLAETRPRLAARVKEVEDERTIAVADAGVAGGDASPAPEAENADAAS